MPCSERARGSTSRLNCGLERERGIVRTSATSLTLAALSIATNSSIDRLECPIIKKVEPLADTSKRAALVHGDVIGFVALDFVLRVVFRGVPQIALMGKIPPVHLDDFAAHARGFRVPADVAADSEFFSHCRTRLCRLFVGD